MLELIKYILQDINQVLGYAVCAGCITVVLSFGYVLFCKGIKRKLGNRCLLYTSDAADEL